MQRFNAAFKETPHATRGLADTLLVFHHGDPDIALAVLAEGDARRHHDTRFFHHQRCELHAADVTVEFTSMSKTFSMAGWRIGFAVGNERIIAALARVKSYLDYGAFTPIQVAATAALNGPDDCIRDMRDTYRKRRDALVESFGRAGWDIPPPQASMFAWAPLPKAFEGVGSMEFATLMVEKSGVVVSPGVAFGEHGEGYVRIAMVENEQRIRQAARGVRRFLESGIETLHNVVPLANRR